jgi:hypothetical protein
LDHWLSFQENFVKASEVDQDVRIRGLQTMYEVMIWVQDGLITIPITLIIRSHNVGFTHLERHTYKRDDVVKP